MHDHYNKHNDYHHYYHGMRTLNAANLAQAAATESFPRYVLAIQFASGTAYYSDQDEGTGDASSIANAQGRVKDWGTLTSQHEQGDGSVGDMDITLNDADLVIRTKIADEQVQHVRVTLYLWYHNLAAANAFIIASGEVRDPLEWDRTDATVAIDISDLGSFYDVDIGLLANRDRFPAVASADEDIPLPIVYGNAHAVRSVLAQTQAKATILRSLRKNEQTFYVDDSREFPQGTAITVQIDHERMTGSFSGSTFTCTSRAIVIATGITDAISPPGGFSRCLAAWDTASGFTSNEIVHWNIIMVHPVDGLTYSRRVIFNDSTTGEIRYIPQITNADLSCWEVPIGTAYTIRTPKQSHTAGAEVRLISLDSVYIANMLPSVSVKRVYFLGSIDMLNAKWNQSSNSYTVQDYSQQATAQAEIELDPTLYTTDTNDAQFGLDHNTTTITMTRRLGELYPTLTGETLLVDLEGADTNGDGTGTLIENPADVIQDLLTRLLSVPIGTIDAASFATAKAAMPYKMAFARAMVEKGVPLCSDLAYQARCALLWDDDVVRLVYLSNATGATALSLTTGGFDADSMQIEQTAVTEIYSEVHGAYTNTFGKASVVELEDAAVELAYGRNVLEINFWAYDYRVWVKSLVAFWLARTKFAYEIVNVTAYLNAVAAQRHDIVALEDTSLFPTGMTGEVLRIKHKPGSGEASRIDTISLRLRTPIGPGCTGICETDCESTAQTDCDLVCQTDAQIGCIACETACQALCQLSCVTGNELGCTFGDIGYTQQLAVVTSTTTTTSSTSLPTTTSTTTPHVLTTTTTTTTTAAPTTTTTTTAYCNDCDPALPDTMTCIFSKAILASYGGSTWTFQGPYTLTRVPNTCYWRSADLGDAGASRRAWVQLDRANDGGTNQWQVGHFMSVVYGVIDGSSSLSRYSGGTVQCDATGLYPANPLGYSNDQTDPTASATLI